MPDKNTVASGQAEAEDADERIQAVTGTQNPAAEVKPYKVYTSQEEFDNEKVKIREIAERKAKRDADGELLKLFGLKPEDKDKLEAVKKAYESSLTVDEKTSNEIVRLTGENEKLKSALEEKEYIITALTKTAGIDIAAVEKIVKMAKGLRDDNTDIEQAINTVFTMMKKNDAPNIKPVIPHGTALVQPDPIPQTEPNPFKQGEHYSMTDQAKLLKTDPEKARRLAKEAGIKLKF